MRMLNKMMLMVKKSCKKMCFIDQELLQERNFVMRMIDLIRNPMEFKMLNIGNLIPSVIGEMVDFKNVVEKIKEIWYDIFGCEKVKFECGA